MRKQNNRNVGLGNQGQGMKSSELFQEEIRESSDGAVAFVMRVFDPSKRMAGQTRTTQTRGTDGHLRDRKVT